MAYLPRPYEIYKHFKGNLYQITAVATHTETDEILVVYQAMYGDFKTYARPLDMFLSEVDRQKYPEATQKYRFELQSDNEERRKEREQADATRASETKCESEIATEAATVKEEAEESGLDPMVIEFLDADSYEKRLNILAGLHHRITDEMITTMAVACDIEVSEGDTEERYASLKNCLLTREKYECKRLR